jgi:general stress protein CsbA
MSEAPAVPHLVLMIVLVISSIIATGATTYWLITMCQKKMAARKTGSA